MTRQGLQHMLEHIKAQAREGDAYEIDPALDVTVFAQAGIELVTVSRVERLELRTDYVALRGAKGETTLFPYDYLAGLRVEPRGTPASGATSRTPPGFEAR